MRNNLSHGGVIKLSDFLRLRQRPWPNWEVATKACEKHMGFPVTKANIVSVCKDNIPLEKIVPEPRRNAGKISGRVEKLEEQVVALEGMLTLALKNLEEIGARLNSSNVAGGNPVGAASLVNGDEKQGGNADHIPALRMRGSQVERDLRP